MAKKKAEMPLLRYLKRSTSEVPSMLEKKYGIFLAKQTIKKREIAWKREKRLYPLRPVKTKVRGGVIITAFLFAISCGFITTPSAPAHATDSTCSDLELIFARGSGEPLSGPNESAWEEALRDYFEGSPYRIQFYELGIGGIEGLSYPAISVGDNLEGLAHLGGAVISGGERLAFGESVTTGVAELVSHIRLTTRVCPGIKFALTGYSQGAMVISKALPQLDPEQIVYAATLGDPKLYLPEGAPFSASPLSSIPEACYGHNLSEYRIDVPDCFAYEGVLGSYRPYQPEGYSGKLGSWCLGEDIMCSSGMSLSDHTSYPSSFAYLEIARCIFAATSLALSDWSLPDSESPSDQEVAFIIDASAFLEHTYASFMLRSYMIAEKVIDAGGRVGLYVYYDGPDSFEVRTLCGFGCSKEQFRSFMHNIEILGRYDSQHHILSALDYSLDHLNWTSGASRSIVFSTVNSLESPDARGLTRDYVLSRSQDTRISFLTPFAYLDNYLDFARETGGTVIYVEDPDPVMPFSLSGSELRFALSHYYAELGQEITFTLSSPALDNLSGVTFKWDFNDDGLYEQSTTEPQVSHVYHSGLTTEVAVSMQDDSGELATASVPVVVVDPSDPTSLAYIQPATIHDLKINQVRDNIKITYQTDADAVLLAIDDLLMGFVQDVTLSNVSSDTEITLIPYRSGRRGTPYRFRIPAINSAWHPTTAPTLSQAGASQPVVIPKVPNTGIKGKDRINP